VTYGIRRSATTRLRVYDCRHAAATIWLRAGVPLGDVAARMDHSVETLVSTYVGALEGDEAIANERIEAVLTQAARSAPGASRSTGSRTT
jgi:integrase